MSLYTNLKAISATNSDKESLVQEAYNSEFKAIMKVDPQREHHCDAHFVRKLGDTTIDILVEYKYDMDFKNKAEISSVLVQLLFYLKKFHDNGIPPTMIFVGDVNEFFFMHTNPLLKYLNFETVDWTAAPSSAAAANKELLNAIINDADLMPIVYTVEADTNFEDIMNTIVHMSRYIERVVFLTAGNAHKFYKYFVDQVLKDPDVKKDSKTSAALLMQLFLDQDKVFEGHAGSGLAHFENYPNAVKVDEQKLHTLLNKCVKKYSYTDRRLLTSIFDRLIEDETRRKEGKFFTPSHIVEEAHKYISKNLGEDWRQRCLVWDNSCGTMNLTAGYAFDKLFLSTIDTEELDTAMIANSGNNARSIFVMDFLNDSLDFQHTTYNADGHKSEQLQTELNTLLSDNNTPLVFFCNPPYANTGSNKLQASEEHKNKGSTKSKIFMEMQKAGYGKSGNDVFNQFLYRMTDFKKLFPNKKVYLCFFGNAAWLTGDDCNKLRSCIFGKFQFKDGFMLDASEFSGTAKNWPILFSIFESIDNADPNANFFSYDIYDSKDKKVLSYADKGKKLSEWVRAYNKHEKVLKHCPTTSDALTVNDCSNLGTNRGCLLYNALGYMEFNSNARKKDSQHVSIFSFPYSNGNGFNITKENFIRSCVGFAARRLPGAPDKEHCEDPYFAPNESTDLYKSFISDALIVSIFDSSAKSTSVEFDWDNKHWKFANHFFWMDKADYKSSVLEEPLLTGENNETPYWVTAMQQYGLNDNGMELIYEAFTLLKQSQPFRSSYSALHPELQLEHWDAGWKQLKNFWKEVADKEPVFKIEYDKFMELRKNLFASARAKIVPLGFLKEI